MKIKSKHMRLKSSEPFWLLKQGLKYSYPSLNQDLDTEILIVGGGITGALIAHQMMQDGYKTTIIDRRDIGNGSTSASTAMLQYEIDVPLSELTERIGREGAEAAYWSCSKAIDKIGRIAKAAHSDCGFTKKKSLYYAAYKKDLPFLRREYIARYQAGFSVQWKSAEQLLDLYGIESTGGGILSDQGASLDAFCLTHDIIHFHSKKGLAVYDKTNLTDFEYGPNFVNARTEYGDTIRAQKVIFCNGFESTEMIKEKFVKLISTYAVVSERLNQSIHPYLNDILIWNTAEPYLYVRTTDDHRLLVGGEDEEFQNPIKRDAIIQRKERRLVKSLSRILPDIDFRADFAWAGTFGETKDGLPYIGAHPDFPSAFFVLGFGGNGITFSATGMEMVSDFLQGKTHPLVPYFRFGR